MGLTKWIPFGDDPAHDGISRHPHARQLGVRRLTYHTKEKDKRFTSSLHRLSQAKAHAPRQMKMANDVVIAAAERGKHFSP
jgi:hypothetical protein